MNRITGSHKFRAAVILLTAALIIAAVFIYKRNSTNLLDKDAYSGFKSYLEEASGSEVGNFSDQRTLMDCIEKWADDRSLKYKEDAAGNIIFDKSAVKRKKNVSPTLIAVSMNYETASRNSQILASAAAIALSDVVSGRRTVVFFNDEQGLAEGYKGLGKKYISSKTKIIYLDKGSSTYISTGSFQERFTAVTIPAGRTDNSFDTAVRIRISGIKSDMIGPGISDRPDPAAALSTLLIRLKSKSVSCGLSDLEFGSNGNMYPVSVEATIALNSYNLSSFTAYIDKCIKDWYRQYDDDFGDTVYEYEVSEDEKLLPKKIYDAETTDRLTGILYTIKSGAYRYSQGDALPDGKETGDVYGINCLTSIDAGKKMIRIGVVIQGVSDSFTDRLYNDNKAAAELYDCSYEQTGFVKAFLNDRDSLSRTFRNTCKKVNNSLVADSDLPMGTDDCFTPCSYLASGRSDPDIIHVRVKGSDAAGIANSILCYIKTKGNISLFR